MLELLPDTARLDGGRLTIGGLDAAELVARPRQPAARLRRGDDPGPRPRLPRGGSRGARRLRDEGVPERRGDAAPGRGGDRRRRLELGELRFAQAAGLAGESIVVHGNNKSDEELARLRGCGRARRPRLARGDRPRARRRRHAGRSSASRPGSRPTRTSRSAPATTARSSGSRPRTRWRRCGARRRSRGCTCTSARSSGTLAAAAMAVDWIAAFAARAPGRARLAASHARPRRRPRRRRDARASPSSRSPSSPAASSTSSSAPGPRNGSTRRA